MPLYLLRPQAPHKPRYQRLCIYSDRKLFTGFDSAAFVDW